MSRKQIETRLHNIFADVVRLVRDNEERLAELEALVKRWRTEDALQQNPLNHFRGQLLSEWYKSHWNLSTIVANALMHDHIQPTSIEPDALSDEDLDKFFVAVNIKWLGPERMNEIKMKRKPVEKQEQ